MMTIVVVSICRPDHTLQDIVYKLVPGLFQGKPCHSLPFVLFPVAADGNRDESYTVTRRMANRVETDLIQTFFGVGYRI